MLAMDINYHHQAHSRLQSSCLQNFNAPILDTPPEEFFMPSTSFASLKGDLTEDDEDSSDEDMNSAYRAYATLATAANDVNPESSYPDVNMAQQLLDFAQMVNRDMQKLFGRRKDEDACDIFENRLRSGKSGRELYYADLMRVAQGLDQEDTGKQSKVNSGRHNPKAGLGPLNDLFEESLKNINKKTTSTSKQSYIHRCLPVSFFQEPHRRPSNGPITSRHVLCDNNRRPVTSSSMLPDFSDLLESWDLEEHQQHAAHL